MARSACPFCFTMVDTSNLAYQCSGRSVGDKKCEQAEDKDRKEKTGSSSVSYPTFMPAVPQKGNAPVLCPHCGGIARRRACPSCHTALPEAFIDVESPMLGIVGSKGGGKTVLMTVLTKQLRENIGKRFQAAVRFATDNPDGFSSVGEYIREREELLFDKGVLPTGTVANRQSRRRPVVLLWQSEGQNRLGMTKVKSTTLSFIDSAGEDFNELETAFSLDYLTVCDGLMVTLDPFALPGARASLTLAEGATDRSQEADPLQAIERITEILRVEHGIKRRRKITVPFAVVFTKIDAFFPMLSQGSPVMKPSGSANAYNETDGQDVHEHMKALLSKWNAEEIDLHLRLNYERYRFFGVSALGAEPIYEKLRVADGGVRPHRVEDPILWLLAKEGTVKSV